MNYAFCNELCEGFTLTETCALASRLGYDGLEFAPFTLASRMTEFTSAQRRDLKQTCADHNLDVVGLHWLLAKTEGFHISTPDDAVRARTLDYYKALIQCCGDIGGKVMIHGSPQQRNVVPGDDPRKARDRAIEFFRGASKTAADHDVTLCLEPLGPKETDIIVTADDAAAMMDEIDSPSVALILDCKAMVAEGADLPATIRKHAARTMHFHANDDNLSYPGSGNLDFTAILAALRDAAYDRYVSIEVFDFSEGAETIARQGLAHLKACAISP